MNKYLKGIFLGVIAVVLFMLGKQCNNTPKNDLKPIIDTIITNKVDTIRDTVTRFKMVPKSVIKYVEIKSPTHRYDSLVLTDLNRWRVYDDTLADSNIVLFIEDTIQGYHRGRSVFYHLRVPLKIYDSTTVTITKNIPTPILPKNQFGIGLLANPKSVNLFIDFTKNRNTFMFGYDPINKIPTVGYKYILFKSKK